MQFPQKKLAQTVKYKRQRQRGSVKPFLEHYISSEASLRDTLQSLYRRQHPFTVQ